MHLYLGRMQSACKRIEPAGSSIRLPVSSGLGERGDVRTSLTQRFVSIGKGHFWLLWTIYSLQAERTVFII